MERVLGGLLSRRAKKMLIKHELARMLAFYTRDEQLERDLVAEFERLAGRNIRKRSERLYVKWRLDNLPGWTR